MNAKHGWWTGTLLALALALTGWSVFEHFSPVVLPADAPREMFSAMRAFEHTKVVARAPHPAGTAANAAVADYIAAQIRAAGLTPEFQDTPLHWSATQAATVHNVLARIAGTDRTRRAVLLMGHYDSVAWAPGAADDGSGVVVLLEAMRALLAGPKCKHDVIFLFSDGEEGRGWGSSGLRGAEAFVSKHPWFAEVAVVLNFDCRGNRGPAYMYETSEENGWLIAQLQQADCHPLATSFMYEVFHSMPVQSDYSRFKRRGTPGLNMAFVDGLTMYHTALDDPAHLDLGSLQHMGYYAVNLTRHLANTSLDNTRGPGQIYFNTLGYQMVRYPASWVLPLSLGCLALLAVVFGIGVRRGHLTLGRTLACAAGFLVWIAISAGIAGLVAVAGYQWRSIYILYSSAPLTLGCLSATLLVSVAGLRWLSARFGLANAVAGVLGVWALLLVVFSLTTAGASYLPLWALVGAALGTGVWFWGGAPDCLPSRWALAAATLGAAPGLLLWPGIVYGLYTCLTIIFAAITCASATLLAGLLAVPLAAMPARAARVGYALLAVVAILAFGRAALWPGFSAAEPQFTNLAYALDADTRQAWWLSSDCESNPWIRAYIPEGTPRSRAEDFFPLGFAPKAGSATPHHGEYRRAAARVLELAPPHIQVVSDITESNKRRLTLHVDSPRGASVMELYAAPETKVLGGTIEGIALLPVKGRWFLSYSILSKAGFALVLEVEAGMPIRLRAVDHSYGFPEGVVQPRPDWLGPKPNTPDFNRDPLKSDETIVAKSYEL